VDSFFTPGLGPRARFAAPPLPVAAGSPRRPRCTRVLRPSAPALRSPRVGLSAPVAPLSRAGDTPEAGEGGSAYSDSTRGVPFASPTPSPEAARSGTRRESEVGSLRKCCCPSIAPWFRAREERKEGGDRVMLPESVLLTVRVPRTPLLGRWGRCVGHVGATFTPARRLLSLL
jgi:hypothetical protein